MTEGARKQQGRGVGGTSRRTTRMAWSLCALSLTLTALSLLISALNLSRLDAHVYDYWLENAVQAVSFSIIGAIIASRQFPGLALLWSSLHHRGSVP